MAKTVVKEAFPARPRSVAARKDAAGAIVSLLEELYPHVKCALSHRNAFELLCATVLSAQTTDARVNSITPELFRKYPDALRMAEANRSDLEQILRPLGFFRSKAKSLQELSISLVEKYDGEVPDDLESLVSLRGVGRKTANVVLGNAFGVPGITVDTHVGRLSRRWGWTRSKDPVVVEKDIAALLPPKIWTDTCHRIISHGRQVCHSRKPACEECALTQVCPSYSLFMS